MADDPAEDLYAFVNVITVGSHPTIYPWATATGDYVFPRPVRAMRANDAGDIQYKDANGDTKVAMFTAGETRMLVAKEIVAAGTTVTELEGLL